VPAARRRRAVAVRHRRLRRHRARRASGACAHHHPRAALRDRPARRRAAVRPARRARGTQGLRGRGLRIVERDSA
jgi:hypothetical protein